MPLYQRQGRTPKKRHIAFRNEAGGIYHEELLGNEGFSGLSSLLYHIYPPTMVQSAGAFRPTRWYTAEDPSVRHRHFRTAQISAGGNAIEHRHPLLWNADVALLFAKPTETCPAFYRNGQADELIFVSDGGGVLESAFGHLPYRKGDYLIIPRGITYTLRLAPGEQRYLVLESRGVIRTPKRYRNAHGQHHEMSPFSERDFRLPELAPPIDQRGEFTVLVKQRNGLHTYVYARHPFDVVGWDGFYFPWALNVEDFEPRVGLVHLPPPVHQSFEGDGFVVCNFVPRPYDFHPDAIPVPYHHSNAQSDEVLYYASERFMSRRGIEYGSITLHPDGIPHGPHPGLIEPSIGAKGTDELAIMVDTFRPLSVGRETEGIEDAGYWGTWQGEA